MRKLALSVIATLAIIYIVPFPFYGLLSVLAGLEPPSDGSPVQFMIGVLVSKVGIALAFVLLFYLGRTSFAGRWPVYALVWWLMFVIGEVGQAIGPGYSWPEAAAGIVSESIYFPLSAFIVDRWLS
jgi:energy-converting hydrogenase Eha subunit E